MGQRYAHTRDCSHVRFAGLSNGRAASNGRVFPVSFAASLCVEVCSACGCLSSYEGRRRFERPAWSALRRISSTTGHTYEQRWSRCVTHWLLARFIARVDTRSVSQVPVASGSEDTLSAGAGRTLQEREHAVRQAGVDSVAHVATHREGTIHSKRHIRKKDAKVFSHATASPTKPVFIFVSCTAATGV